MKTPIFTGSAVAIVTPFRDGRVDYEKFGELIDFQIKGGTSAIVVCGTTGASAPQSMSAHARRSTSASATSPAASRSSPLRQQRHDGGAGAVAGGRKSKADALLMVTPYYNKATQRGLIQHYTYVADRVASPSSCRTSQAGPACRSRRTPTKRFPGIPIINGIKEASGNFVLLCPGPSRPAATT
jgi:4-hydroxy-tetrahydrodipicolinate synthase